MRLIDLWRVRVKISLCFLLYFFEWLVEPFSSWYSGDPENNPDPDPQPAKRRRQTSTCDHKSSFLGLPVCKFALRHLYGVGGETINRVYKGERALHYGIGRTCPRHPELGYSLRHSQRTKWTDVVLYFWQLYHSVAEVLPERFEMPAFARSVKDDALVVTGDPSSNEDLSDGCLRHLHSFLQGRDKSLYNPDTSNVGPGTMKGPRRFMQTATPSQLYSDYRAFSSANGKHPSCYNTFRTCYHKVFKTHLGLRSRGTHAMCNVCSRLKVESKKAKTVERKKEIQLKYASHLLEQWLDRQYYWGMRAQSAASFRSYLDFGQRSLVCLL